ncbi:small ubiquitin-related modifier 2-like [Monodon monoceros]|uniref:small ubiquitin-related modifier 2-like n=1 Tax=Monodon monoceros TaxID=40151 RepID=UPI0010F725DB|nr:small ubiquitin-related modifier 2-like [Monodon monoceros]
MANEEPQEGVKTEDHDHVNTEVVRQDGSVVQFEIWRHTPAQLEMKDEDTADVSQQQTGGVY